MTDYVTNGSAMPLMIQVALDAAAFGYDLLYSYSVSAEQADSLSASGMRLKVTASS